MLFKLTSHGNMMLEVRNVPGRGRGLFTTRLVKAGEDLVVESPLLLTVSQDARETACAHCLKQLSPVAGTSAHCCFGIELHLVINALYWCPLQG